MTNFMKFAAAGILAIVLLLGAVAYSVLRTPAEATQPIAAIPLSSSAAASAAPASTAAEPSTAAATEPEASEASAAASSDTTAASTESSTAGQSTPVLAQIVQDETEARFIIDEVLNNAPKTVIGVTNQVAGEFEIDPQDPTKSRVGVIQVNARTLTTDSDFRNRAIKNQILSTDQYEFITFTPKQLVGLPQSGSIGQSYTFQIVGDLTIRDVTREVTFDVTATPVSETRMEGSASTTLRYADFNISIPQVRQVASVSDEVRLEIDFVAAPK